MTPPPKKAGGSGAAAVSAARAENAWCAERRPIAASSNAEEMRLPLKLKMGLSVGSCGTRVPPTADRALLRPGEANTEAQKAALPELCERRKVSLSARDGEGLARWRDGVGLARRHLCDEIAECRIWGSQS